MIKEYKQQIKKAIWKTKLIIRSSKICQIERLLAMKRVRNLMYCQKLINNKKYNKYHNYNNHCEVLQSLGTYDNKIIQ